jgi:DNA-binding CsgD family transcriptional regulator
MWAAGWLAVDGGDLTHADACLTEALALARDMADAKLLAACLLITGHIALIANDLALARQQFEEVRTYAVTGEPLLLALATANLGQVTMAMGDLAAAQELFEQALAAHESGSGPIGIAFGHLYLGQVTLARGDHARSARSFREAIIRFATAWGAGSAARAVEGLAGVVATHQPDRAARLLGAAVAMRDRDDWLRDQVEAPAYERAVATIRTALGEPAFEAAWNAGKRMSEEDVLAEVDSLVDAVASPSPVSALVTKHGLTPREMEVLVLLAEGRSDREIAAALGITYRTVTAYVRNILDKFNVTSRTAAATLAVRRGLV